MSDEYPEGESQALQPAPQGQTMRVDLSTTGMTSTYTNLFRVTGTFEELVIDFGLHTGLLTPAGPEPVKLAQRVVMNYPTAKRLLAALQAAVSRHEQVFGVVEVDPQKRMRR